MHAHKVVRHLAAAALVAGLATSSLSVISTQAVGASPTGYGENVSQIITNVHDCLNGGYVNYSTATGKTFKTAVGCVIYALFGGTLVALPDFVLVPSCTYADGFESCGFTVENMGLGPATGNLVLDESLTSPQAISDPHYDIAANCFGANAQDMGSGTALPTGISLSVSCTNTFPPGATTEIRLATAAFGTGVSGQSLTFTAVVNPNRTIAESNYANDSFSQTVIVP